MNIKSLLLLPLICLIASCSQDSKKVVDLQLSYVPTQQVPRNAVNYRTEQQLRKASQSMDQSMNTLAKMKIAESPAGHFQPPSDAKATHMSRLMTINWNGPMLAAVQKIASYSHYKVRVIGNIPAVPLIVNLSMVKKPMADVLRNIQYQTFNRAKIVVYPATNYLEIRYIR